MRKHHVATAVILTWVLLSFIPSLGVVSLYQRVRGKKG